MRTRNLSLQFNLLSPSLFAQRTGLLLLLLAVPAAALAQGVSRCVITHFPPESLVASNTTSTETELGWTAPSIHLLNCRILGYVVYRDGNPIARTTGTSYSAGGLSPSTTYKFAVGTLDEAGVSPLAAIAVTTMSADNGSRPETSPFPSASRAAQTNPAPASDQLEGIYVAQEQGYAHWYYFKPSGAVALDCDQMLIDPDEALTWPTYEVYVETNAEERGYRPVACSLGRYQLQGEHIRFNALAFSVDPSKRTKFRERAFAGDKDRTGDERLRTLRGFDVVQIVKAIPLSVDPNYSRTWVLVRQSDQTGRKLEGEFFNLVMSAPVGTLNTGAAGTANFSSGGQFSLAVETSWEGNTAASPRPGGSGGTGRYEIQGHEIIFYNSDGTVSVRNFGYLGKDRNGREFIAIGGFLWVKGDIFPQ